MHVILLTHPRELERKTNTGQLGLTLLPDVCSRVIWSRVSPDELLVQQLAAGEAVLLFPSQQDEKTEAIQRIAGNIEIPESAPQVVVILDATWQEARKMFRQSQYLKEATRVTLPVQASSIYTLRRNQVANGLCTAECIIQLLKAYGLENRANGLNAALIRHCQAH